MKIAVLVWSALLASTVPALAQEQERVSGMEEQRFVELATWLRDYDAWEKWFERWGNRVVHNFNDQMVMERKERPAPPFWLAAECKADSGLGSNLLLTRGCDILEHWDDHPSLVVQRKQRASQPLRAGQKEEKVVKTSFLRRVHLTGGWAQAQYPSTHTYGIVGMQVGVVETGRFTIPAIGVMLMMIPDGHGGHEWKPATTLGFGFRLFDFVPPLLKKQASLHFNLARTSVHGAGDIQNFSGIATNVNLVGLSVSAKKGR
jgi:hypothetical protein